MKSIHYYLCIAMMAMALSGCNKADAPSGATERPMYQYLFAISIKDTAGNDLVAPLQGTHYVIHEKPEGYTLDIIPSNPRTDIGNNPNVVGEPSYPHFGVRHIEGSENWYLLNMFNVFREYGPQEYLTYRISSSIIFGDNQEHDIVAYWGEDPFYPSPSEYVNLMPECLKVVFDGKDMEVKKVARTFSSDFPDELVPYRTVWYYMVDIVLDR
ncbi:MAG: hypothetical protein IKX60_05110 [Bacteroidales bacterium]|nr:hypothetical protein [Bacteroidales bacterium]